MKPTREKQREYNARWRAKNPEKHKAIVKADNLRRAGANKKWREKNKEKLRAYAVAYRPKANAAVRANREKIRQREQLQRLLHPHKHRAKKARRRARKLCATPTWLTRAHLEEIKSWYILAVSCGSHVDHVVPLMGKTVCGLHVPWNLQLLSRSENTAKGNRLFGA